MSRFSRQYPDWQPADELPIAYTPPVVRCRCGHGRTTHTRQAGQCWIRVCGCTTYRPQEETP